ncbi:hypothetical protein I3842_09G089900 [Carya illinoinensis]|uniref:Fungal lipase-type domain-containing protein n=1 Tax=Carya illinoinensis TaxID=32201 RepID=A0A922E241_CARIL|nr:hypothetical protein I3842_09G089900 [Carya illinoinensis]
MGLCCSHSSKDLRNGACIRRSYSDNHFFHSNNRIQATTTQPKLEQSTIFPSSVRSFLFDLETSKDMNVAEKDMNITKNLVDCSEGEGIKRSNWVERLLEIGSYRRNRKHNEGEGEDEDVTGEKCDIGECDCGGDERGCAVDYRGGVRYNCESFSRLLVRVPWSDTKLFSQFAFLCNMGKNLRKYYGLHFVTSSLEKKVEAAAIKAKLDEDSTAIPQAASEAASEFSYEKDVASKECPIHRSVAYEIAASALCPTIEEKTGGSKGFQSLQSSPCEWFICDDLTMYTHYFEIQGSDSLASWQAHLFFEPTKFEGTDVVVHRGIYEAVKGIYEQFMPEIVEHLNKYGEHAKLQFTGHSLGGSLSLLVSLMLLTRKVVNPSILRSVVTFGSPFVFCGGQNILDELGLDESHIHCMMMHRDIVPRAFSCNYPNHVAGSSPPHPLLPPGSALYALDKNQCGYSTNALAAFLSSPHLLETLTDPIAYGSDGTILRDHHSSNYLKAVNRVLRQCTKTLDVRRVREQKKLLWPLLTSPSPQTWNHE